MIRTLALAAGVGVVIAVIAVIGLGSAGAKGGHRSALAASRAVAEHRAADPGFTLNELLKLAFKIARRNGDAAPKSIEAVKTTHRETWRLMFPAMPSRLLPADATPVWFVVMIGHFRDRDVGPSNITVTGTQLHLVVDLHGHVLDGGLNRLPVPNLARVGPVKNLEH